MSCNGYNHYSGCTCAFSGGWKGGSRAFESSFDARLFTRHLRDRSEARQKETWDPWASGYTNPNAKCPVCHEPVFFYRSPYGGRVFFDDLGPPWPKHPCTDNSSTPLPYLPSGVAAPKPAWHQEGWRPLTNVFVDRVSEGVYKIRSATHELVFRHTEPPGISAARARVRPDGAYEISLLEYDERIGRWVMLQGTSRLFYRGLQPGDSPLARTELDTNAAIKHTPVPRRKVTLVKRPMDNRGEGREPRRLVLEVRRRLIS